MQLKSYIPKDIEPTYDSGLIINSIKAFQINAFKKENAMTNPIERQDYLLSKINTKVLNESQMEDIRKLLYDFSEAFYIEGDVFKQTDVYEHSIKLKPDVDTIYVRQYRIPETQKQELQKQIDQLLERNITEKSTSRFNSPLLLVKKPSNNSKDKFKLVIDYRKLNEATIAQSYPMPLIDEITDNLHSSQIFTILDVFSAFHQIRLQENCRHLTAFSTNKEHYQFKCAPFGLQSSPIFFILTTDASKISCSGILSNRDGHDERPIQYFSRSLNDAQSRYSAVELELLAIIWSVEWFRSYLYGRKFYISRTINHWFFYLAIKT